VFEYRRTPYLGLVYAAVIGFAVTWLLETPERPLTLAQAAIFYALSYLPGLGLAMLSDPASHKAKAEYLKVDFYAPRDVGETGE
jgi:hypothetical protein